MNKTLLRHTVLASLISAAMLTLRATPVMAQDAMTKPATAAVTVSYGSIQVDGLNIAYREAGDPKSPKLVLLHGFPASSHQYRDLIRSLAGSFHVIAPDYPGLRRERHARPRDVRLHLRRHLDRRSSTSCRQGLRPLRPLRAGLRRPGRLSDRRAQPEGARLAHRPEHATPTRSASPPRGTASAARCGRTARPRPRSRSPAS